jgi:hypothetical protein
VEDFADKARTAAVRIEGRADSRTIGVRLLTDVRALFDADLIAHCMASATIVAALIADPEGPWAEFSRGKPLTQNRLAKILGAYVDPLAKELEASIVMPLDVSVPGQMEAVF